MKEFRQSTHLLSVHIYNDGEKDISARRYFILYTAKSCTYKQRSFEEKNILHMSIHRIRCVPLSTPPRFHEKLLWTYATCSRRWYQAVAVKELSHIRVTNRGRKYSVVLLAEITTPTMIATANDRSFFISMCHSTPRINRINISSLIKILINLQTFHEVECECVCM